MKAFPIFLFTIVMTIGTGCSSVSRPGPITLRDGTEVHLQIHHKTSFAGDDHVVVVERVQPALSEEAIAALNEKVRQTRLAENGEDTAMPAEITEAEEEELRKERLVGIDIRVDTDPGLMHDLVGGVSGGVAGGLTGGILGAALGTGGGGDATAIATGGSANAQAVINPPPSP